MKQGIERVESVDLCMYEQALMKPVSEDESFGMTS